MIKFFIREKLPSLNEVINKNRTNRYGGAAYKGKLEKLIGGYILQALGDGDLIPMGETPCEVYCEWHEKTKRRDCDNIHSSVKFILDALQKHHILKNDNRRYVKQIHHKVVDDTADYVVVELKPVEAE